MAVEHCDPGWDYLGKDEHAAYVFSFTLEIFSCLKLLYGKGLFYYRYLMHRLTIKINIPQVLCLDRHDATLRRAHHHYEPLLEATTPTFFPCLVLGGVVGNRLVRPTAFSGLTGWVITERLKIDANSGHAARSIFSISSTSYNETVTRGRPVKLLLTGLLGVSTADCHFPVPPSGACPCRATLGATFKLGVICPSKPAHTVIPNSSCRTPSGMRNRNLSGFTGSAAGLITLCLCFVPTSAAYIAESVQIRDVVHLIPHAGSGGLHLVRRATSTHDASWRSMVIGGTIGSTAGAAILGIGIYLLFRARRKRRTADLSRSESEPIEMQPTRSSRARSSNVTQVPRSRPPPRAPAHDTSGGPSSWAAKTPRTPSLASLELQPRLLHPRDISRATHIRASTGSQFTEHFEPVLGGHRRFSGGPSAGDNGQSPGAETRRFQGSADLQGSAEHADPGPISTSTPEQLQERFGRPRSDSQMTAPLPPGAAAPVESVGNYTPPEASNIQPPRIQLS
ncbi:unnamed protein product [Rhizoctonia solani]|uniref:Uncharacterized protein n=1 Tax=Rhizoctonia solani TaxID=456999 RepID=A0A8H3DWT5_9AGAM|nr:unnamed protein product [Rhizoctonia solani]